MRNGFTRFEIIGEDGGQSGVGYLSAHEDHGQGIIDVKIDDRARGARKIDHARNAQVDKRFQDFFFVFGVVFTGGNNQVIALFLQDQFDVGDERRNVRVVDFLDVHGDNLSVGKTAEGRIFCAYPEGNVPGVFYPV